MKRKVARRAALKVSILGEVAREAEAVLTYVGKLQRGTKRAKRWDVDAQVCQSHQRVRSHRLWPPRSSRAKIVEVKCLPDSFCAMSAGTKVKMRT